MSIRQFLEERLEALIGDLRTMVEKETPSTDPLALYDFAVYLDEHIASIAGARVEIVETHRGATHVRAEFGPSDERRPILLLGHFDTVWPAGTLSEMPFRRDEDRIYGPGSFDMKAGLVQGLWAIRSLIHDSTLRPVVFLATSDEEIGSPTSRELIEREARRAAAVFVLEPSLQGALKTARKGVARFRINVVGRAAHAGVAPEEGVSAIEEVSRLILSLHALSDSDRQSGTSVNVGMVGGGTRYNVVPGEAWAEVDVRIVTARDAERVTEAIHSLKPMHPVTRVTVEGGLLWPPMELTEKSQVLFRHACASAKELGMELRQSFSGGASDGNFCAAVGAAVLDGLGAVGGGAHAVNEHVVVSQLAVRAALLADLIRKFDNTIAPDLTTTSK